MKKAFVFPGQGAQYVSMGRDFFESYALARQTFEEADEILGRGLSGIIFNGPESTLTETKNSQTGIYVVSIAILRVIQELFPELKPDCCAGLSLGEYTAATAAGYLNFSKALPLVQSRGQYMNDACVKNKGTMAVILGLAPDVVKKIVQEANMPNDLWVANYNCPGQIVISGTIKGVEKGADLAKKNGAKRVLPLNVFGAFHSGLMQPAKERLKEHVLSTSLNKPSAKLIMNVSGKIELDENIIKNNLIEQVTSPVHWEQSMRMMDDQMQVKLFVEMGPGQTLSGFNKRIGVLGTTISIDKIADLHKLEQVLASTSN